MKNTNTIILLAACLLLLLSLHQSTAQCVITLQPDAIQGKDAPVWNLPCNSSYAVSSGHCLTNNYGTAGFFNTEVWTWWGTHAARRSYLEFDLSSLPPGCTVSNATLTMYSENNSGQYHCGQNSSIHPCISNQFNIYRVTRAWDEMTINWNNQPGYATAVLGQDYIVVPNNSLPYNNYTLDITTMVNYWLANPSQNNGMLFKMPDETTHYKSVKFASSDHLNPAVRPKLVLTLNCPTSCNNTIEGNIFDDQNSDCSLNTNDIDLENWVVEILPGPIYASTDVNGHYSAQVIDGTYSVTSLIPNTLVWNPSCPSTTSTQTVSVGGGSVATADFALDALMSCPILTVDVSSNFLRKCHTENFIVNYCNTGNVTAQNVYIDVDFSSGLTPLSSNASYTVNSAGQWSFPIGTLAPGACASFYITTQVSCTADFGDIECVTAAIFPDYPCSTPPGDTSVWDRSSVMVNGYCDGDSLACFVITNTGSASNGNMQGTSDYRIYENNILVSSGTFQLTGGASTTICWPANGNTIRLEADQRPGHPGNSHPNDVVENCGAQSPNFNFGTCLPEDDAPADIAIECAEVRSSYDPNDKGVVPTGVGSPHYVGQNQMLDYKIRFQNTGNDTAFQVVVLDVLSDHLDISSIQLGASSHNYSFSIENNRELKFRFYNIMLPDSNTNEPMSHGFVKFKVQQKPNLPIGTVINNSASIYFDYNAPVLTNNTFLTIGNMESVLNSVKETQGSLSATINLYPNPFNRSATVFVSGHEGAENISFELFNLLGARVQSIQSASPQFEINREDLPAGVYYYRVHAGQQLLGAGKTVIE